MRKLSFLISFVGLGLGAYAQDTNEDSHTIQVTIPEVALLDIEGSKDFSVAFTAPTQAGNALNNPTNNTALWLNWSSIVTDAEGDNPTRAIKVKLDATIPGLDIKVTPGTITGGQGSLGTIVSSPVTLTTSDQDLVTAIGSCYTEDGVNKGSNLTYSFTPITANYGLLVSSTPTVTVTYTLTDL
ncbi:hypothetical protein [Emticicia sp. BO119]|uniref:hypothetical protein n=1 Tax=Emticicia sp. BO119 TaxID=2757768 RepID=UPI0015F054A6|nr:hypothetical protein [Emticicia sp. BO119]MBA4851225.1 hypothetical protein [Emticicia sp. BO119]